VIKCERKIPYVAIGIVQSIILKLILKEWGVAVWTGFK
jgi:hypothetical protein